MRVVVLVAATSLAVGCKVSATFTCETSAQCGVGGACEPNGLCSFPDATCNSGRIYGEYSGELSGVCVGDEPVADAPPGPDSAGDAPTQCAGWSPQHFDPCMIPAPIGPLGFAGVSAAYDTTTGVLEGGTSPATTVIAQAGGVDARVMSVTDVAISSGQRLLVYGSLPLIVAVWGNAQIDGTIDAGSRRLGGIISIGPGSDLPVCDAVSAASPGQDSTAATGGSGGGGGGGFQGVGGDGGQGDNPPGPFGGPGGGAVPVPTIVRGGCPGGNGGAAGPGAMPPATPTSISDHGRGGGAVQISALGSITIGGTISSGGAGGGGSPSGSSCGGGGGGSGGFVGLDAATITVSGILAANGGGGGASQAFASGDGASGSDGAGSATAAAGGAGTACATAGGSGSVAEILDGADVTTLLNCGGGGGGGAAGFVVVWSPAANLTAATVSPPAIVNP